jgi:peptidyl-prolyl cis-trans isomerase SurA
MLPVLAVMAAATAAPGKPVVIDSVAAFVNDHVITMSDVLIVLQPIQRQLQRVHRGAALKRELRKAYDEARQSLVERQLILGFHEKSAGKIPEWVVDERAGEIIHELFDGDRSKLLAALEEDGLTYGDWRDEVRQHVIVSLMRRLQVQKHVEVSPREVREEYEKNEGQYRTPGKVRLRMIVLSRGTTEETAAQAWERIAALRKRVLAGEDFASLARTDSRGQYASKGGDWGWVEPRILLPALAKAAAALEPGQVSEVIPSGEELYLLKVEGRRRAARPAYEDVQPRIESKLKQREAERIYRAWIQDLERKAYVKVFDENPFE